MNASNIDAISSLCAKLNQEALELEKSRADFHKKKLQSLEELKKQLAESSLTTKGLIPSGPRQKGEGVEDNQQGILSATETETGGARLSISLLAAGFVIGSQGVSVREISRVTGAEIRSWNDKLSTGKSGEQRKVRTLVIEGKKKAVVAALQTITAAVDRYKDLCESGKYAGKYVERVQCVNGVEFYYSPPPKSAVPLAAGLKTERPSSSSGFAATTTTATMKTGSHYNNATVFSSPDGDSDDENQEAAIQSDDGDAATLINVQDAIAAAAQVVAQQLEQQRLDSTTTAATANQHSANEYQEEENYSPNLKEQQQLTMTTPEVGAQRPHRFLPTPSSQHLLSNTTASPNSVASPIMTSPAFGRYFPWSPPSRAPQSSPFYQHSLYSNGQITHPIQSVYSSTPSAFQQQQYSYVLSNNQNSGGNDNPFVHPSSTSSYPYQHQQQQQYYANDQCQYQANNDMMISPTMIMDSEAPISSILYHTSISDHRPVAVGASSSSTTLMTTPTPTAMMMNSEHHKQESTPVLQYVQQQEACGYPTFSQFAEKDPLYRFVSRHPGY